MPATLIEPNPPEEQEQNQRRFNRWCYLSILNPFTLTPAFCFVFLPKSGEITLIIASLYSALNLDTFLAYRSEGSIFISEATTFWTMLILLLPFNVATIWWLAARYKIQQIMFSGALRKIYSGTSNIKHWSLYGGYLRLLGFIVFWIAIMAFSIIIGTEPTSCKGCEKSSAAGFLFFNWLGFQSILWVTQAFIMFALSWNSLYKFVENKNV